MRSFTEQTPTSPNEWLYKNEGENRLFARKVALPDGATSWSECTNADKEQWEEAHRVPMIEDTEPIVKEIPEETDTEQ